MPANRDTIIQGEEMMFVPRLFQAMPGRSARAGKKFTKPGTHSFGDPSIRDLGCIRHFVWDPRVRRENYDFLIGIFRIRLF